MTRHRIVCTDQEPESESHDQAHIVEVGVGSTNGNPNDRYSVMEVRNMLDDGDQFYTKYAGVEADVHKYSCDTCGEATIRTDSDSSTSNNLDNLPDC